MKCKPFLFTWLMISLFYIFKNGKSLSDTICRNRNVFVCIMYAFYCVVKIFDFVFSVSWFWVEISKESKFFFIQVYCIQSDFSSFANCIFRADSHDKKVLYNKRKARRTTLQINKYNGDKRQ